VDFLLNILLFVPLGAGLGLYGVRLRRAVFFALTCTCLVEALQFFAVPGRYASFRDIMANFAGALIGYLLGRKIGREVLQAPGPFQHHRVRAIAAGDRFYEKHGNKAVFFGRWIALVRVAAAWLAGINHMPFHVFFFWNALGAITWGTTFGLVGYFGGTAAANVITRVGVYAAIAVGVAAVVWLVVRLRRRRSAG